MLTCFFSLLLVTAVSPVTGQPASAGNVWSKEKARSWYEHHDWISGANFVPSTAINQIEMWQDFTYDPETIDRELGWAEGIGFNTMRVFLHYLVWTRSPEGLKERIDNFLSIAERHHIKIVFVLFDDVWGKDPNLGEQPDPVPGVHNSGWVQCPGEDQRLDKALYPVLEAYTKDIVSAFGDDDRVLMWDLYNEPGNGKNPPSSTLPLLKNVVQTARQVNPSQPITIGLWNWSGPFDELNDYSLSHSDIITFHDYNPIDKTRNRVEELKQYDRPLVCTEYMARTNGSTFKDQFPFFAQEDVGAINWGLVSGKTQTIYSWSSPKGYSDQFYNAWRGEVREVYPWESHLKAPEPEVWFHDVFRRDGTPFDRSETALIKRISNSKR